MPTRFPYSTTRYLTKLLRPNSSSSGGGVNDTEYTLFLLEKYVTHLGLVLQRMIVNKRALQEHLAQGDTMFLLSAPDNSHKELLFLLNHAHLDTLVEPWLGLVQTTTTPPSTRTKLGTLVAHPQFRDRLETEITNIFHKVQNFVQNKHHWAAVAINSTVYTLDGHVEVYATATATI